MEFEFYMVLLPYKLNFTPFSFYKYAFVQVKYAFVQVWICTSSYTLLMLYMCHVYKIMCMI